MSIYQLWECERSSPHFPATLPLSHTCMNNRYRLLSHKLWEYTLYTGNQSCHARNTCSKDRCCLTSVFIGPLFYNIKNNLQEKLKKKIIIIINLITVATTNCEILNNAQVFFKKSPMYSMLNFSLPLLAVLEHQNVLLR